MTIDDPKGTPQPRALTAYTELVRAAGAASARLQRQVMAREGLTETQFGALQALASGGPLCHRELGERLARSGGNVTLVVDNLERRSLVRRQRDQRDRRTVTVRLTSRGRRLAEAVYPLLLEEITEQMSPLTAEEQVELSRLCHKLVRNGL